MKDQGVAIHWAKALFEQAQKASVVGRVQKELGEILQSRRSRDTLWDSLEHPLWSPAKGREILEAAYGKTLHPVTLEFLVLLMAKRRLGFLSLIAGHFERLADRDAGIVRALVRSAFALSEDQRALLERSLQAFLKRNQRTGLKVILEIKEDPHLIAGVTVRMGDWVLEHNLRSQLYHLKEQMMVQ